MDRHPIVALMFGLLSAFFAIGAGISALGYEGMGEPSKALRKLLQALGWAVLAGHGGFRQGY